VVGEYAIAPQPTGAFVGFIYDSTTGLVTSNDQVLYRGISNAGDITGVTVPQADGSQLGYRKFQGKEETFSCFNARYTYGESINAAGDVVGVYTPRSNRFNGAFLYHDGQCIDLSVAGATYTAAWSINDNGDIVGQYARRLSYGNFYLHDGKLDLDRFSQHSGPNRKNVSLVSINNDHVVTGLGSGTEAALPPYYGRIISLGDRSH
jgi:probable HAF family extracellular repeat protein